MNVVSVTIGAAVAVRRQRISVRAAGSFAASVHLKKYVRIAEYIVQIVWTCSAKIVALANVALRFVQTVKDVVKTVK